MTKQGIFLGIATFWLTCHYHMSATSQNMLPMGEQSVQVILQQYANVQVHSLPKWEHIRWSNPNEADKTTKTVV